MGNMSDFVYVSLDIRYPDFGSLRSSLDAMFGGNYQLSVIGGDIRLKLPRYLTSEEKSALRAANSHSYYEQQNEAIRSQKQHRARANPSLPSRSSPSLTNNPPIAQPDVAAARSTKTSGADETNNKEAVKPTAGTSTIPLVEPTSLRIFLDSKNAVFEFEPSEPHKQGDMEKTGFYSFPLEDGETSSVFNMKGHMIWSTGRHNPSQEDGFVTKVAVKRLHEHISFKQFWAEYHSLKLLESINHPHIVDTLGGFRYEENGIQHFNFMFPLAFGNLKRLFRGSYDKSPTFQRRVQDSLWDQFVGLSSAVAYLHDSMQMAHRDIKPSNILIYEEPTSGGLILKLTDFGLAVDLNKAETWEEGTLALQSAWLYDSPESQRESANVGSEPSIAKKIRIPSATELSSNDIWKLGSVFTEMVAFLGGGGSTGVNKFRDYITTTESRVESDLIYDTGFHDGFKVKVEVLEWLDRMARRDTRARQLRPILGRMLAKSADRPTIKQVCEELVEIGFPNVHYSGGLRLVRFTPADQVSPLSRIESLQLDIENWIGRRVDWWPIPRPRPKLRPTQFLMTWEWQGIGLCIPLSRSQFNSYSSLCLPRTTDDCFVLPITEQRANYSQPTSTYTPSNNIGQAVGSHSQPPLGSAAFQGATAQSSAALPPVGPTKDMYWCFEKVFTEPTEHHMFTIFDSEALYDDEELYRQVNKAISATSGWRRWLSSFRRCTEVEFIKVFCLVWKNGSQVHLLETGRLPPTHGQVYTHSFSDSTDVQTVMMAAAREQMIIGLGDPKRGRGEKTNSKLPRKRNPPSLAKEMGEVGWGLHVKMGLVLWKFLFWMILPIAIITLIFVVPWLYKNPTDLQNAFVPTAIIIGFLSLVLAAIQMLEIRGSK